MAAEPPPPPRSGGGLSLYANLLDPEGDKSSSTSISRGPVVSQEALDAVKDQDDRKPLDSALRFQAYQQIRRPQQKTQKPKPANFPRVPPPPPPPPAAEAAPPPPPAPAVKSTLADWAAANDDDEYMYGTGEKRARGGRRGKKKKNKGGASEPMETDWNEIYDPSRPTNVDEYLRSDERIREVQEWKALLYKHRRRDRESRGSWDSEEEEDNHRPTGNQFAPPESYSFAPPPPSPPRAPLPDDRTGDDAFARRLALSQGQGPAPPPPPRSPASPPLPPPPPPPPLSNPETSTISREPVRYTQPPPPPAANDPDAMAIDGPEEDEDAYSPSAEVDPASSNQEEASAGRSNRPGQKGFAARLMTKYGWSKGQGLGASASGIVQPLRVQVEKRKKRPDSEGGGWAEPGGRGRIIGSKTARPSSTTDGDGNNNGGGGGGGKFGPMSNVVVLRHMLEGMEDLQGEMENGLGQEIGEECGDKYGRVERLYIDVEGRRVYIKFTDQVSALRAVNALDGRVFAGNTITPQFYDVDKFEGRVYE
ncbi:hypothetical protein F4778DRAFT_782230 [Xylariomycetidae sp. FL2044]|nr:hypothetical protein F4778DRAFT_782230 [Xylariomycetidae sp. FL2044]